LPRLSVLQYGVAPAYAPKPHFKQHLPEMFALFSDGAQVWNTPLETEFIKNTYPKAEKISIDFGVMEKASNVKTLPVDFGWCDIGTWGRLYEKLPKDPQENAVVSGNVSFKNAKGNIVKTQNKKQVLIQGINDCIVVEKDDVLLICPRQQEQDIKPPEAK